MQQRKHGSMKAAANDDAILILSHGFKSTLDGSDLSSLTLPGTVMGINMNPGIGALTLSLYSLTAAKRRH